MGKPFSFVPLLKTQFHKSEGKKLTGIINLKIEVLNALHVSQDSYDMTNNDVIYKEFYKNGDSYAIPGTSLKGVIRSIAEMVSYGCISMDKKLQKYFPEYKHTSCKAYGDMCIICDTFGAMGKGSKIKVSNFKFKDGTGKAVILGLPVLRSPNISESHIYCDENNKFNGYKIYNHGISSILKSGDYKCECFKSGAIFEGKILYENLDEQELGLLCYAAGLCGDFNHKIGYGKPAYYGSVKVSCDDEIYIEYAKIYKENAPKDIKHNMSLLEKKYSYKNANKQPDYDGNSY